MRGLFVTGSDTGVGKTQISCAIAARLVATGEKVIARKPVESGCEIINGQLFAKDATALRLASKTKNNIDNICPFKFEQAVSPAQAATAQGAELELKDLVNACKVNDDEFLIVEGAGGWLSPIAKNASNADLADELKLDIVLVVEYKLGCINQTLLSVESIMRRGLNINKIYLNQTNPEPVNIADFEYLKSTLDIPIIKVIYTKDSNNWQNIQQMENLI
jgi:dethiobiotin synthetase